MSFTCELLFTEDFAGGIGSYTLVDGNAGVWTVGSGPYSGALTHPPTSVNQNGTIIRRSVNVPNVNRYDAKFKVLGPGAAGSGFVTFVTDGYAGPLFIPREYASNDAGQRAQLNSGAGPNYFGSGPLSIGDWYQLSVIYSETDGESIATITNLTNPSTPISISIPGSWLPIDITTIQFVAPVVPPTRAGVMFSDIQFFHCVSGPPAVNYTASASDTLTALESVSAPVPPPLPPPPPPPRLTKPVLSLQRIIPITQSFKA